MLLFGLIFLLVFLVIGYKLLSKMETSLKGMIKKEDFSNITDKLNIKNECKRIQESYNKLLTTPVAVNIPNPEYKNKFYIGENSYGNENIIPMESSFHIKEYKYDGIYDVKKESKNDFQMIDWNTNSNTLFTNLPYNINKLIITPEKNLQIGQEIVSIGNLNNLNNINNYNDKLININTQKDCNNSVYSDTYTL